MPIDVYAAMGALVRAEAARRSTVPAQSDATAPPIEPPEAVPVPVPAPPASAPPRTAASPPVARPPRTAVHAPVPRRGGFLRSLRTAWRDVWGVCR
ncbi:hypothetical protein [Streptomyces sp. NBRC 110028]|uniref:hypothetical protein n=1 Tax=Streptomyces sp. NBRC 110028 TaxID=1621260 RepID=UPI0006E1F471|nr:hypothetical protein [Streptomyces sp. NBRC 110028]